MPTAFIGVGDRDAADWGPFHVGTLKRAVLPVPSRPVPRYKMQMDVGPPEVLKTPLLVREKLLMGPGPSNVSPRVLHAMSLPMMGHLHKETCHIMDEIKAGLQYAFQTTNTLTLAVSSSGHGAIEAAMCNLIERGDKVLIGVHGIWGERAADMATRYGGVVERIEQTPGKHLCPDKIEEVLREVRPILFFITQGESSTGVWHPLERLGAICHKYDCLLVVDTVASLGGVPVFTDRWDLDVVYTGSQKVLGAPPGLAPMTFGPRAIKKIRSRKTPIAVFYWDMTILGDYWACFDKPRVYHHTIPVSLLYGLREGLAMLAEEGLQRCWERHRTCAKMLHAGIKELGLELFVEREDVRLPTVTTIRVPDGVSWQRVTQFAMDKYLVEISGGLGPTAGKVFRIGIMGYNATPEKVHMVLKVFKEGLEYARNDNAKL